MKKSIIILLGMAFALGIELPQLQAQKVYKVDISEYSRNNSDEILEPGFTLWKPHQKDFNETTLNMGDGVSFTLRSEHNMRSGWNKAFVQSKEYNCRFTGDGVNLDPNECGQFSLIIKGLAPGQHHIQTYHNSWANPATTVAWPITLQLNGESIARTTSRSMREASIADATVLISHFQVTSRDEEVVFTFITSEEDAPEMNGLTSTDKTPMLNGFMIDAVAAGAQAKRPNPADGDMHVDADQGHYLLSWEAAGENVLRHHVYFGLDSASVAQSTTPVYQGSDTTWNATELRNLDTYYWRVDEETADGSITQGLVWHFRPRHLAFPGAEGYGRFANGGRGGIVYHVTNLSDDGQPGSFRYGMETLKGKRTIVFDVSGIIDLRGTLRAGDGYATVAGQTAPGKGICFSGAAMGFGNDQIIRHIRNRVGSGPTADGMGFRSAHHAIMDHCSISWSIDEGFSSREAGNITLQRTLISESLNMANHDKYDENSRHGFAAVFGGDIGSFHHNLLANNSGRNPRLDGGMDGNGYYMGRLDIFNNVVYNWNSHPAYGEAHEVNFHRNYYKMGPASTRKWILIADVNQRGSNKGTESYYYMYNVLVDKYGRKIFDGSKHGDGTDTNVDGGKWQLVNPMTVDWNPWVDQPFFPSHATVETAYDAYKSVLSDVGCTQPVFDNHDQRQVRETQSGVNKYKGSISGLAGLPDTEEDVGGYEVYPEEKRDADFDTDQDGMPNWWEQLCASNADQADNNLDPDGDGYTLLEDYLNFMAEPHLCLQPSSSSTLSLQALFVGYTDQPQYNVKGNSAGLSASINEGVLHLAADADAQGLQQLTLSVVDKAGSSYSRTLGVAITPSTASAIEQVSAWKISHYEVYDLNGHLLLSGNASGCNIDELPLKQLSEGIYILKVSNEQGQKHSCKMIK